MAVGRVGLRQGQGLGGGWGLCLGPTELEKALRVGWSLGSTQQEGPRDPTQPPPRLWRVEDQIQDPAGSLGLSG